MPATTQHHERKRAAQLAAQVGITSQRETRHTGRVWHYLRGRGCHRRHRRCHKKTFDWAGFIDPLRLLAECEKRKLEGIVSKRIDAPYRSGDRTDWIKVKSQSWREANKGRWRLFEESRRAGRSSNGR